MAFKPIGSGVGTYKLPTTRLRESLLNTRKSQTNRTAKGLPFKTISELTQSLTGAKKKGVGSVVSKGSSKSSSARPASYNYAPAPAPTPTPSISDFQSSSTSLAKDTTDWINQLKKEVNKNKNAAPKLPAQIDYNKYRTEMATIKDLEKKFGFDYSREYAERQAEILAQAQRDALQTSRERADYELESAKTDLEHDFFGQYLEQRQNLANLGLNAGIAAERDLRLDMNRQYALADILANAQLYQQELDRDASRIDAEQLAYAERLYNERLSQGFGHALDYSRFNQSENQFQAQMAMQQRNQLADEAWREFEWNNMSYADRVKLIADAERYGMDMAWERHKFDAGLAFDAAFSGGGVQGGTWRTTKGEPPQSFKNHLTAALNATGYPSSWIQPVSQLIANESSWNPNAKNPKSTAHGYGQFLNSTRRNYEKKYGIKYDNPVNQLVLTLHYIKDRYGDPFKAMEFWNKNKWY